MSFQSQTFLNQQHVQLYVPWYWNSCVYINMPQPYPKSCQNNGEQATSFSVNYFELKSNKIQKITRENEQCSQIKKNLQNKSQVLLSFKESCYNGKQNQSKNQNLERLIESSRISTKKDQLSEEAAQIEAQQALNQMGKTHWTIQEQQNLKQLVNLFGKRWKYISEYFPNRTGKQIRQRYLNYLRPNLSLKKWTIEEDKHILELVEKYGHSWRTIEKKLKNRSQNQIKNRYYGHLEKIQKSSKSLQIAQTERKPKKQKAKLQPQMEQKRYTNEIETKKMIQL